MKQACLFLFLSLYCIHSFSQNRNKVWCFGEHAGLNFNTNPPSPFTCAMSQTEGCSSMSDNNNGQLLFYSDGATVWNRNHQVMQNGTGLLGDNSSTQSALIIPAPNSANIYYVFTLPSSGAANLLLGYSIVDMTLAGGLGAITTKNIPLHVPVTERLTGTLKSNGIDYWIVAKEFGTDVYLSYSVTSTGVDPNPVISHCGLTFTNQLAWSEGYARISPDGSKLCVAYTEVQHITQLFDFNNNTGIVSNAMDIPADSIVFGDGPYGVEFSPDNTKLYILQSATSILKQYDLLAGSPSAIVNSAVELLHLGESNVGGALMLGPDDKIYVSEFPGNFLSVIDKPNLPGTACNFIYQAVSLGSGSCWLGLPNSIHQLAPGTCPSGVHLTGNVNICTNQTYQLPSGTIVNSPGIFHDTIRNQQGTCDSIITIVNLSIFAVSNVNVSAQICSNQSYQLPSGTIVNTAGIYVDTIRSIGNCDSVITTVNVTVFPVSNVNVSAQICSNQSYQLPSGTIVNTAGIYVDTIRSIGNCDSVITNVNLSVLTTSNINTAAQICTNQSYQLPSGTIVNTPGIYQDTIRSIGNCDSVITTVNLSVLTASNMNTAAQICSNQTYQLPSGTIVNAPGIYQDTIRSIGNCDSVVTTVNLSVLTASNMNTAAQICSNQTYQLPSGTIVNAPGIYQDTIRSIGNCDSVVTTVNLSVLTASNMNTAAQICSNQTYQLPSGTIVNTPGIYQDTIRSIGNCDSVITTVNLSVLTTSNINTAAQICTNQSYQLPSGTIVNTPGIYQDTIRSIGNCDSVITTVTLSIFPVSNVNTSAQICSNQTYQLPSGAVVSAAGFYTDTIRSVNSCDSIINTIHLLVNPVSFFDIADSIYEGGSYILPSGQTVNAAGIYQTVLVNSAGCDSVITTTLKLAMNTYQCITLRNAFTPNEDGVNDVLILYRSVCFKRMELNVFNRYGQVVYQSDDYKNDWNGKYKNKNLPDGTYYYFVRVYLDDEHQQVYKNNVTIMR